MIIPRRRFLGSTGLILGNTLLDRLTTPLWGAGSSTQVKTAVASTPASPVQFIDVAERAGLKVPNVWGGAEHKRLIIETKGSGIAFFDYDNDGWLDIYLTNGSRLDAKWPAGTAPTTHLFKNNRDGTFTDVTEKSGIGRSGWQTGICVGDYDNDGWDDLFCTFWGHNILFHNNGNGTFSDVAKKAGLAQEQAAASSTTIATGISIFSSATSSISIPITRRPLIAQASANGKAFPPCAGLEAFRGTPTSFTAITETERSQMSLKRPAF
jgi:enediyne biosynthesis protein E4